VTYPKNPPPVHSPRVLYGPQQPPSEGLINEIEDLKGEIVGLVGDLRGLVLRTAELAEDRYMYVAEADGLEREIGELVEKLPRRLGVHRK
jgi:hypothetical protein